ncbi:MAG: serine/threonine protein kinase [Planctomycetota bacterium]|nr:MAG: serine/threonine protein kinase [Planctomycetota bacterium]
MPSIHLGGILSSMDRSHEALYALLTTTLGFVERERLLQAWPAPAGVRNRLRELGLISEVQAEAVDRMVESHLARNGGRVEAALAACSAADPRLLSRLTVAVESDLASAGRETTRATSPPVERFVLGAEIGRGGLGRVVSAWDTRLRRDVAVKLVLDGMPAAMLRRFSREAEITGRLEHPNIVPVHDFGPLIGGGKLGLCMKKVQGRDLRKLLEDLAAGDEATRRKYSLPRLLRIFQDVCLAMAFAHDRGVHHRDLKPSNVMIGDFGETLVVDWGLAKEVGVEDGEVVPASPGSAVNAGSDATKVTAPPAGGAGNVTAEGTLMGTPAYMAPEQAAGRYKEVDARSDIYSLGAVLYEILTLRPPVRGESFDEIVTNVREGRLVPPSERASSGGPFRPSDAVREVPLELEAICLRALAFRKEDRFATAMELHDEVQLFLEGVKQRERQRQLAEGCVRKAKSALERQRKLSGEALEARTESRRMYEALKPHEDKSACWEVQDRARDASRLAAEARAEADRLATEALGHDPEMAEARGLRAEMAWENFLEAERRGLDSEAVLQRHIVEQFDDGTRRARLEGTGTLSLRTVAWPCRCLAQGREVRPEEWMQHDYHRLSGRLRAGRPESEGLRELEPAAPVRMRVHGADCVASPVSGARVWAYRFEERRRLLVPVTPAAHPGAKSGGGPAPLATTFAADSPFLPIGPGVFLGRAPLESAPMPMGSWLLVVEADGFAAVRVPLEVQRCADVRQDVALFRHGELGSNDVPIAAGTFHFQGDDGNAYSIPGRDPVLPVFAMQRFPVTAALYAEFLNALAERDPAGAIAASPRSAPGGPQEWAGPPFAVPTAAWLATASPESRALARRPGGDCASDWEPEWPVFGISWCDAMRFAAWRRFRDSIAWVLPTEEEWEKAARGVDARPFVGGPYLDDRWACQNRSFPEGPHPAPVTAFPHDESPWGVRGMAGNAQDHVVSIPGPEYHHWRLLRGGAWTHTSWRSRTSARLGDVPTSVARHTGFRLARILRLGPA